MKCSQITTWIPLSPEAWDKMVEEDFLEKKTDTTLVLYAKVPFAYAVREPHEGVAVVFVRDEKGTMPINIDVYDIPDHEFKPLPYEVENKGGVDFKEYRVGGVKFHFAQEE